MAIKWVGLVNKIKYTIISVYLFFWIKIFFLNTTSVTYTMPDIFQTSNMLKGASGKSHKDYCRLNQDDLQLQHINPFHQPTLEEIEKENVPQVSPGGVWRPQDCVPFQQVAIIIPYRNRMIHLTKLLYRLHPMLRRQKIHYQIFVVEQAGDTPFNRGMLMNVGTQEAMTRSKNKFDCFIFHDVDLLPEHDRNIYMCDNYLRHLSSAIDEMRYHVMFENYAGGVIALTWDNLMKINGYPNIYWGWGNEDDDFSARALATGLKLTRPPEHVGRFKMAKHLKAERSQHAYELFLGFRGRQFYDGLSSLGSHDSKTTKASGKQISRAPKIEATYQVLNYQELPLYTNISVDLDMPSTSLIPDHWPKTRESFFWFLKFYGWWIN